MNSADPRTFIFPTLLIETEFPDLSNSNRVVNLLHFNPQMVKDSKPYNILARIW